MHKIYILVNIQSKNGLECYWLLNKPCKHVSTLIHVKEMCIIRRNRFTYKIFDRMHILIIIINNMRYWDMELCYTFNLQKLLKLINR